jgi:ribosomal protein S18 acetylase RimI-like enzyme
MADFRIRKAEAQDSAELSLIGGAAFLEAFADELNGRDIVAHVEEKLSTSAFRQLIDSGASAWLVEHSKTEAPLGYAMITDPDLPVPTTDTDRELRRIYFLPRCHGTGAAAALLSEIVMEARSSGVSRLLLGVYAGNARAAAFYAKHGFRRIGERAYRVGGRTYDDHVYALNLSTNG